MGEIIRRTKGGRFLGWYVRYTDADGKRKQRATKQPTKEGARRFLVEVEARIARGNIGIPEPAPPSATVAELCARFLAEYSRPRIKDIARYRMDARKRLRRCLPTIGNRQADLLTPQDVGKLRDQLSRKMSPGSVGDAISTLGRVFNWCMGHHLLQTNPVRGVERPKSSSSYDFYSREEVTAILATAEARTESGKLPDLSLAACVRLALHTGMRKGELLGLRWRDLDLKTLRLTVARSYKTLPKSGKARHLRLPSDCVAALQRWRAVCPPSADGEVFPPFRGKGSTSQAMLGLPKLLAEAGVRSPAHPWHACRHSFASHYMMSGGNILALQKILGHSDVKMTMIYAHLAPDYLGEEMERLKF